MIRYIAFVLLGVGPLGCDNRDEIVAYSAPKDQPAPMPEIVAQPSAKGSKETPMSATPPSTAPSSPAADVGVAWKLPAGWIRQPDRQMVVASFKTGDVLSAADVIVTKFPVAVMNDPLANINRYRGMVGLTALTDASAQPVEDITVDGSAAKRYQFDGAEKKLTIIMIPRGELAWFLRFLGPIAEIDKQKPNFESFVNSLHW